MAEGLQRPASAPASRAPGRPPARPWSWKASLLAWGVASVVVWGAMAIVGAHVGRRIIATAETKSIDDIRNGGADKLKQSSVIHAADGEAIYTLAEENRKAIRIDEMSPFVIDALVAVEDAQFYEHKGINPRGIVRAAVTDAKASLKAGRLTFPEGGSSLTQQLAKLYFLTNERTANRKVAEALYALHIEKEYQKDEILAAYLNKVALGNNRFGVESASQYYFGKPCKDLTLAEAALIAGLGQAPSRLNPVLHPDNAVKRRNKVLERMVEAKKISREQADAAKAEPLVLATEVQGRKVETQAVAPYFVEEIRRDLVQRPETRDVLMTGGLSIETTLDMDLQRKATVTLLEGLRKLDKHLTKFRPITRNLVAEEKDPDAYEDPMWLLPPEADNVLPGVVLESDEKSAVVRIGDDRITVDSAAIAWTSHRVVNEVLRRGDLAPFRILSREPGTQAIQSIRLDQDPLLEGALVVIDVTSGEVLAMAGGFDYNRSQFNKATQALRQAGSSFKPIYYAAALEKGLRPSTTTIDEPTTFVDAWTGELYQPENYYKDYHGRVTLRESLEKSLNIPSVRLLNYAGYKDAIATARRFGLTVDLRPYPSMALGAFEMTLLEMTSAYSVFPNGGIHVKPTLLRRVKAANGAVLYEHEPEATEVITPQVAFQMVQLMRGVVKAGTAKEALSLGRDVAGKTGTTDDYTDAWFIGYTPSVVVGVWTGYEKEVRTIGKDMSGAKAALPIWIDFMRAYFEGRPAEEFANPGGIEFVAIDKATGLVMSETCPPQNMVLEAYAEGNRPIRYCSPARHRELDVPRCLQRFGMDDAGFLLVPDERFLFDLETSGECPISVDPIDRVVAYAWSPVLPPSQFPYRMGAAAQAPVDEDSIEALMAADRRTTRDGLMSDFDVVDGRTVIVVRNDR